MRRRGKVRRGNEREWGDEKGGEMERYSRKERKRGGEMRGEGRGEGRGDERGEEMRGEGK